MFNIQESTHMNRPYIMYEKVCTYVVLRSSFVYILNLVRCISRAFSLYITSYVMYVQQYLGMCLGMTSCYKSYKNVLKKVIYQEKVKEKDLFSKYLNLYLNVTLSYVYLQTRVLYQKNIGKQSGLEYSGSSEKFLF